MVNIIYISIISIFIVSHAWESIVDFFNAKWFDKQPDSLVNDIYDNDEYNKQQLYKKENYKFSNISGSISFVITALILIFGIFGELDIYISNQVTSPLLQTLIFFAVIGLGSTILSLPFSYFQTFVIEEKFGFNKSTKFTFWTDTLKSLLLGSVLGGIVLSTLVWIYNYIQSDFWWIAWIFISVFSISLNFFYSTLIVPLFNKQTPLENGELKEAIENFGKKAGFEIDNIYVIDGSKRSSKANAYFTGFGKKKRIVLYDTLINQMNTDEIVAVLAHEIGHYKHKHTIANLLMGIVQTGIMLYILSLFLSNTYLSVALGGTENKFHLGIIAFSILFSPISEFIDVFMNMLSRKFEYQADDFAKSFGLENELVSGLKNLSKNSYSNLTPHPLYVFTNYSHPPIKERIENLRK
ncbi:MAG: M48 family metallopeptidase [Flavobacteriales bacterium]|nr:M48 family metallopeptidase [Flavobacteriales bacterium]